MRWSGQINFQAFESLSNSVYVCVGPTMCYALSWVLGTGGIPALKELTERQEIWAITKQCCYNVDQSAMEPKKRRLNPDLGTRES